MKPDAGIRACRNCKYWKRSEVRGGDADEGECRYSSASVAGWPAVGGGEWCGRFMQLGGASGGRSKITDATVLAIVGSNAEEPGAAVRRATVVEDIMAFGLTETPAIKRIERMVRQGTLAQGPKDGASGLHVWIPKQEEAVAETRLPSTRELLLGSLREIAPRAEDAKSIRGIHREVGAGLSVSLTTVHRLLHELATEGLVQQCEAGYYAGASTDEATAPEIE